MSSATAMSREAALEIAQVRRARLAEIRRQAHDGTLSLADIVRDPPTELHGWTCVDVIRLKIRARSSNSIARLGRLAVRDGVNLLMPIGRTSQRSRLWIIEHACWHISTVNGGQRLRVGVRDRERP